LHLIIVAWEMPMHIATRPAVDDATQFDTSPVRALVLDLLAWVAREPRTYGETLEAWRTSCPRLPVWEEAVERGLLRVERAPGLPMHATLVCLTARGQALLDG
jgi:hypothetical protein